MSPRLIGYGISALLIVGLLWVVNGWRQDAAKLPQEIKAREAAELNLTTYRATVERQARAAAAQQLADQQRDAATASRLASLQADNEALRRALGRTAALVEKTNAQGQRSAAINPVWWLCLSAQLSRDAADIAACQASAGDGSVPRPVGQ